MIETKNIYIDIHRANKMANNRESQPLLDIESENLIMTCEPDFLSDVKLQIVKAAKKGIFTLVIDCCECKLNDVCVRKITKSLKELGFFVADFRAEDGRLHLYVSWSDEALEMYRFHRYSNSLIVLFAVVIMIVIGITYTLMTLNPS